MVPTSGEEFDFLGGLAASQREFHETSVGKISFVENKLAGRGGSFLILFVVVGCFTWVDGAFSFGNSHALLTSSKRCVGQGAFGVSSTGRCPLIENNTTSACCFSMNKNGDCLQGLGL